MTENNDFAGMWDWRQGLSRVSVLKVVNNWLFFEKMAFQMEYCSIS